jgi:hypothetical protein
VVQRVSENRDFLVLTLQGVPGAREGSTLLLSQEDRPVAEVELSSIDSSGMTMAFVTRALQDLSGLEPGSVLTARVVVRTSSADVSTSESP